MDSFSEWLNIDEDNSLRSVGHWVATKWAYWEQRYGRKTAFIMALSMLSPIPFSFTAVVGAAEAIRGIHGILSRHEIKHLELEKGIQ